MQRSRQPAGSGELSDDAAPSLAGAVRVAIAAAFATFLLAIGVRSDPPDPANVPIISADGRLFYLLTLGAAALIGFFAQRAERAREDAAMRRSRYIGESIVPAMATAWILPALIVGGAALLAARHPRWEEIAAAVLLAGTGVFASLVVRENLQPQEGGGVHPARIAHIALTLVVAFLLLSLLFLFRMRTVYAAPVIFVVAALLLIQVHDGIDTFPIRKMAYALVGALVLAEVTWALNYWPPTGWYAGAILTSIFLGMTLVTGARMVGALDRPRAAQYAGLSTALFLVFTWLSW
jgi:hypothetical protein